MFAHASQKQRLTPDSLMLHLQPLLWLRIAESALGCYHQLPPPHQPGHDHRLQQTHPDRVPAHTATSTAIASQHVEHGILEKVAGGSLDMQQTGSHVGSRGLEMLHQAISALQTSLSLLDASYDAATQYQPLVSRSSGCKHLWQAGSPRWFEAECALISQEGTVRMRPVLDLHVCHLASM